MVVVSHKDDAWVFWRDNKCHMCKHNLAQNYGSDHQNDFVTNSNIVGILKYPGM